MSEYDEKFFLELETSSLSSAQEIVPLILKLTGCKSVIDIGCGNGAWLSVFKDNGITDYKGIDGDYVEERFLRIPKENFEAHDLSKLKELNYKFDLAISVEVAEHLPAENAESFVKLLTSLADVIVFSAAVPFQEGTNHINEQWADYWIEKFRQESYLAVDCLRKELWENQNVQWWYKQNIFIYVKESKLSDYPKLADCLRNDLSIPPNVIHPEIFLYQAEKAKTMEDLLKKPFFRELRWLHRVLFKLKKTVKR